MNSRGHLILKALICHYHPDNTELFFPFLPKKDAQDLSNITIKNPDIPSLLDFPKKLIHSLHPTWIMQLIRKAPVSLQPLLSSPLPDTFEPITINILFSLLENPPHIPLEYLPKSDLLPIAKWSGTQLEALCHLLGVYDLAAELRNVVDKISIQNAFSCLTDYEQAYLKICSQQKESINVPRLNFNLQKKEPEIWRKELYKRGILRIARALNGQNYNFVWYLSHKMEWNAGKAILQNYSDKPTPKITPILYAQMIQSISFLKKIGNV